MYGSSSPGGSSVVVCNRAGFTLPMFESGRRSWPGRVILMVPQTTNLTLRCPKASQSSLPHTVPLECAHRVQQSKSSVWGCPRARAAQEQLPARATVFRNRVAARRYDRQRSHTISCAPQTRLQRAQHVCNP